jgi:hypothetical protein
MNSLVNGSETFCAQLRRSVLQIKVSFAALTICSRERRARARGENKTTPHFDLILSAGNGGNWFAACEVNEYLKCFNEFER